MNKPKPSRETVKAIIVFGDRLLLQLRDTGKRIYYPGFWGFFGGDLEPDEAPEEGLKRELAEELALSDFVFEKIFTWKNPETSTRLHYFLVPLERTPEDLPLYEGMAKRLFRLGEIDRLTVTPDFFVVKEKIRMLLNDGSPVVGDPGGSVPRQH